MQTRISNSLLIGAIIGILVMGLFSDMYSRRAGLLFTSFLVAAGTLMSTVALQVPSGSMLWYFVVVRGIAGFGVGGEYPPSAAAGLEESEDVRDQFGLAYNRMVTDGYDSFSPLTEALSLSPSPLSWPPRPPPSK